MNCKPLAFTAQLLGFLVLVLASAGCHHPHQTINTSSSASGGPPAKNFSSADSQARWDERERRKLNIPSSDDRKSIALISTFDAAAVQRMGEENSTQVYDPIIVAPNQWDVFLAALEKHRTLRATMRDPVSEISLLGMLDPSSPSTDKMKEIALGDPFPKPGTLKDWHDRLMSALENGFKNGTDIDENVFPLLKRSQ
jgi:hypothetical protein